MSQEHFAAQLGVSQETLSRYERGRVKPSTEVVAICWRAIEDRRDAAPPPADVLARRVRRVGGDRHVAVREAIARLIDISVNQARPGRRPR
jgi:predicted transcriptional regulator